MKRRYIVAGLIIFIILLLVLAGVLLAGLKNEKNTVTENVNVEASYTETQDVILEQPLEELGSSEPEYKSPEDIAQVMASIEPDAVLEDETIELLPIYKEFIVENRHISEWNVDTLISVYGLYLDGGRYLSAKGSEESFVEATINEREKVFSWVKTSAKTYANCAYELREYSSDQEQSLDFDYVTYVGGTADSNPWLDEGVAKFWADNGLVDTKSFLIFLGVSEDDAELIMTDGQKHKYATDSPGEYMIPAVISYDEWNGLNVTAGGITMRYHEDNGRLDLIYHHDSFDEWR